MSSQAQAGQASFAWDTPTTNTDGTPLTDLAGYKLYYWQTAWDMPGHVDVGDQTTYTLMDLPDGQSYSFAVTAYNTAEKESSYSNILTFTIMPSTGNTAPQAVADAATTAEDTAVTIAILTNDTDPDGDALTITAVTQGAYDTVTTNGTTIIYTPVANFTGTDTFSYTVSDGQGGTAAAAVSVTVAPSNDAPIAAADSASSAEDTPVTMTVLANDTDPDGDVLTITAVTQGAHGTVTTNGTTIIYTPAADFTGTDTFSYTVSDGQGGTAAAAVSVTMTASDSVMLWLEAEEGLVQPPMEVDVDAATPAIKYVWGPEDNSDVWNPFQPGGFVHYTFEIPKTDTYVIWGRVSPNTVETGSFFLAVDVEPEEIDLVTNVSPTRYEVASLRVGETYYTDSPQTITAMSAELADLVAIKTANANKNNKEAKFLTFTINQSATLYVAYDARAASFPTWLTSSFTHTKLAINTPSGPMAVWQKEVLAGNVAIPGHRYQSSGGSRNNYLVLLAPHGESPYLVWELATPQASARWTWEQAASDTTLVFLLEAGVHTLTVKQRESGTKLDKILITNDPEMIPQD